MSASFDEAREQFKTLKRVNGLVLPSKDIATWPRRTVRLRHGGTIALGPEQAVAPTQTPLSEDEVAFLKRCVNRWVNGVLWLNPSALSSLKGFELAWKQTESQVMAQSAGLIEIGRPYWIDITDCSWNPANVWLKTESPKAPFTRERQTGTIGYPAMLIYEAKTIKWIHRSA